MIELTERRLRILETVSRYLLVVAVLVFVLVAFKTMGEIQALQEAVRNGSCGIVEKNIETFRP